MHKKFSVGRIAAAVLMAASGLVLSSDGAGAGNFHDPGGSVGCESAFDNKDAPADNRTHTVFAEDLEYPATDSLAYVISAVFRPAGLAVEYQSLHPAIDARVRDLFYDSMVCGVNMRNVRGLVTCELYHASGRCDSHLVRLNNYFFNAYVPADRHNALCHEFGHSVGFQHRDTPPNDADRKGCMQNIEPWNMPRPANLSTHDRGNGHINSLPL